MAFITVSNIEGKVYVPETTPRPLKKHKCHDCFSCQICSESRCQACMSEKSCNDKKSSDGETSIAVIITIFLYELCCLGMDFL